MVLNEVLPVPAQDGISDELDEWIELYNAGSVAVDLAGWSLDDNEGDSTPYAIPGRTILPPGAFLLFLGRNTGIDLDDAGDAVRMLAPDGTIADIVSFGNLPPNASYSRGEDGSWHADWPPSPGLPNLPSTPGTASSQAESPSTGAQSWFPAKWPLGLLHAIGD
jgi:hypothetical protein